METKHKVLALVLGELGMDLSISSIDERMEIQKAIYLVQKSGVNLGYNYSWYLKGPYSPKLTQDYYEISLADNALGNGGLKRTVKDNIKKVRYFIDQKPHGISKAHWLELLASIDYLRSKSRVSTEEVNDKIAELKPHLNDFVDEGLKILAV